MRGWSPDLITLRHVETFHGPSPIASEPVIVVEARFEPALLESHRSRIDRMTDLSSSWYRPTGSARNREAVLDTAGFLADWSLQALTFVRGYLHACGAAPGEAPESARIRLGFHNPMLSFNCLQMACRVLVEDVGEGGSRDSVDGLLAGFWKTCRARHPDYQARIVMEAARAAGIPTARAWRRPRCWQIGWGARSTVMLESSSVEDSSLGTQVSRSKSATKEMMKAMGLPTPEYAVVAERNQLEAALQRVGFPCVTKPTDSGGGRGVAAGLEDAESAREGYEAARRSSRSGLVMVEAFVAGQDHRIMVIDGEVKAVIRREAATVTGDGVRSIGEMVAEKNADRHPLSLVASNYHRPIALDPPAIAHLAAQGVTADSIPPQGTVISLRSNANLSTGGSCTDVTARLHPAIKRMSESLATTAGIRMLGLDYLSRDISAPPTADDGFFIEMNTTPGLEAMTAAGWSPEAAGMLAIGDKPGRIPALLLLATQIEQATLGSCLRKFASLGWVCNGAAGIGPVDLRANDPGSPRRRALMVLTHRVVESVLVAATPEELVGDGLPLDRFDVIATTRGARYPESWEPVLTRHAGRMTRVTDVDELRSLVDSLPQTAARGTRLN